MANFTKDNDNVYLNVVFNNISSGAPGSVEDSVIASYNVTKTLPIVDKCSDYYCSIVRFDIPLSTIPIIIVPIIPNQGNPNLTTYVIGITLAGTDYPEPVIYTPLNNSPVPVQNQITQVITPYYYIFGFQDLINDINEALHVSFAAAGSPGGSGQDPFFWYNPQTQLISLYVSAAFIASGATIFMNTYLDSLLDGFQVFFNGFNQPNGHDYTFVIANPTSNPISYYPYGYPMNVAFSVPPVYYQFQQQYNVITYWFSLSKLIIATNTIPINREFIPGYNPDNSQNGQATSFPIITDFVPELDFSNESRSIAYYNPTSQYRLVDMNSDTALYKIDLQILWEDRLGNLYPLYLKVNQTASVKLAFLKKSLYRGTNRLLVK